MVSPEAPMAQKPPNNELRSDSRSSRSSSITSEEGGRRSLLERGKRKTYLCWGSYGSRSTKSRSLLFPFRDRRGSWACLLLAVTGFIGIIALVTCLGLYIRHLKRKIPHNDIERTVASWGTTNGTKGMAGWPTDFSRDIIPIPCHSHNDYWRKVPLYDALAAGCTSVEADVWLTNGDLQVGHSKSSLKQERTLRSLYVDPLVKILSHQNPSVDNTSTSVNGVFDTDPDVSLTLLIDIKTDGPQTLPTVLDQLEPLRSRGWLTHFNGSDIVKGPIKVVGTGNTPFDLLSSNETYRDIFFDAPLDQLWGEDAPADVEKYTSQNSDYASVSFDVAIGKLYMGVMTPAQVRTVRGQVQAAQSKGLRARYWDTPSWPVSSREHVWDVLVREGADMLNVDDLKAASGRKWNDNGKQY